MSPISDDDLELAELAGVSPARVQAWAWDQRAREAAELRTLASRAWAEGAMLRLGDQYATPSEVLAAAEAIERGDA